MDNNIVACFILTLSVYFGPIEGHISQSVQDRKRILVTKRKSYMSFRLVPKLATLNDLERRNGVILRYFSEFG